VTPALDAVDAALQEMGRLRKVLSRGRSKQVSSDDERRTAKATALTWFHTHRHDVVAAVGENSLQAVDAAYQNLIACAAKATLRTRYVTLTNAVRVELGKLQAGRALELSRVGGTSGTAAEPPPAFDPLVADAGMRGILLRRWQECLTTLRAGAPLSATVMMGGLLETPLLARINKMPDKGPALRSQAAPKNPKTGKVVDIRDWMLKDYIGVAHELKWISRPAKDVSIVLRDYRNYIHPQKEYSHGIVLKSEDARLFWAVATEIIRQVLSSVT